MCGALALVSGLGVHSAKPMIAEVGAQAATFPSAKQLASWVGGVAAEMTKDRVHPMRWGVNFGGHEGKRRKTCTLAKCKRAR
jgi:hypothetical protein